MVLDTTVVPDVLGLHAFKDEVALVRVLPGDFPNIVRVLVPDDRAEPRWFHDLLVEDLSATKDCHIRPSDFPNIVRVLVPDDRAEPRGFHDLLVEDLSATKDCHIQPASAGALTALKQQWPSSLLSGMTKCQVDMESLCRDCKRKFGSGCPGYCPHCGMHISTSLSRHWPG